MIHSESLITYRILGNQTNLVSMRQKWILVAFFLMGMALGLFSQELPKSEFELKMIRDNLLEKEYIEVLKKAFDNTSEGTALSAHYANQLSVLYYSLGDMEKDLFYREKAISFWKNTEVTDDIRDLFGQFLLSHISWGPYRASDKKYLDTASMFLENTQDILYLEALKVDKTRLPENKEEYVSLLDSLLRLDLSDDLRSNVMVRHVLQLSRTNYEDSAFTVIDEIEKLSNSLQVQVYYRYYRITMYLRNDRYKEAARELRYIRDILDSNERTKVSLPAIQYHSAAQRLFEVQGLYDSALYHTLQRSEIYRKTDRQSNLAETYKTLARLYNRLGEYENAEKYALDAIELYSPQLLDYQSVVRNSLLYSLLCQFKNAEGKAKRDSIVSRIEETISEQETIIYKSNSLYNVATYKAFKGRFLSLTSDYRLAENLLRENLVTAQSQDLYTADRYSHLYLSELLVSQKRYREAIPYALKHVDNVNLDSNERVFLLKLIVECYMAERLIDEALSYVNRITEIIQNESDTKLNYAISQYEVNEELSGQRLLNAKLNAEQLAKSQLINRQQSILIIVSVSVVIIIFILFRLMKVHKRNLDLLKQLEREGKELQRTNAEMGNMISDFQASQEVQQRLIQQLSNNLNGMFNGLKGIREFIPEVGKFNKEQERYFERVSEIIDEKRSAITQLISLNSIADQYEIKIGRVSINDCLDRVCKNLSHSLSLKGVQLSVGIQENLLFLADAKLIELIFASLIEHGLQQDLLEDVFLVNVSSEKGLIIDFEIRQRPDDDISKQELDTAALGDTKSYLYKATQLKDLMDGDLKYVSMGDRHKITIKLNLIELRTSSKSNELVPLEIDMIYDKVMEFLNQGNGLTNPELNLAMLAEAIDTSRRKVSYVINKRERTNFNKFVARLRVAQVVDKLENGDYKHLNIAGIGFDAGFNSKSTFFASFKEFVGCTPGEYVSSMSKKAS